MPPHSSGTGAGGAPGLQIDHGTKRYGSATGVDDLSFSVEPGRVARFHRPDGAGTSTTMKILLDLASADRCTPTIGGRRYRKLPDPNRTAGVPIEAIAFHPWRSCRNHLRILADAAGIPPTRVDEMPELADLADAADRRVGAHSLGMRQRLGRAAALLGDPRVLVLGFPRHDWLILRSVRAHRSMPSTSVPTAQDANTTHTTLDRRRNLGP